MPESPLAPEFWDQRYRRGRIPWDASGVPLALRRYLAAHPGRGARVLIPGCGSGYEIPAFAAAGYAVTAIDFSPAAVARAREFVGPELAQSIAVADFFADPIGATTFDVLYERTFLCALPPTRWTDIVRRSIELLTPTGAIVGIYYFGTDDGSGPPFPLSEVAAERVFGRSFVTEVDRPIPAEESLPLFAGGERWQERRRRG